MSSCHRLW
uniref:Uncharacterized protein n=1 Tax=Arundo donax TaxID=35708 RepID=A0A0A8ZCS6_ARUDO